MFTYSHENTSLGQSERAYCLTYILNRGNTIVGKPVVFIVADKGKDRK